VARVRAAWAQQRLNAAVQWADAALRLGHADEVINTLPDLTAEYPHAEPLEALLLRGLHATGRDAEAVNRYLAFRERLVNELGTDPGEELRELHRALLRGELPPLSCVDRTVAAGQQASSAPPILTGHTTVGRSMVWRVPARNQAFTGRQPLLARLRRQLTEAGRVCVAALHGWGGVGKTQLAIEFAHLFASDYSLVWWVDAERVELIPDQLAALGIAAGWVDVGTRTPDAVTLVAGRLRQLPRWLLVFDNAEDPATLRPFLPPGVGHTIITSRAPSFVEIATPVEVDVFHRHESVALLRAQVPALAEVDADRIAEALGDLPLALAQAAGLLAATRMTAPEYLDELATRTTALLKHRAPPSYPRPLAAALALSLERLAELNPAAVPLLHLCAHLAPDPIPLTWLRAAPPGVLPDPLAGLAAGSALGWRDSLGRIAALGLARLSGEAIQLHRLTQAILREQASPTRHYRDLAARLVAAAAPDNGSDPGSWPAWTALLPHLLALDPATTSHKDLRDTAGNVLWYLLMSGQYHTARPLAHAWYQRWKTAYGADHTHTLLAVHHLASSYRYLGDYAQARRLDEDTLTRRRRVLGNDHPDTLASAANLAEDLRLLGRHQQTDQPAQTGITAMHHGRPGQM
jgi:hypothetical protein